MLSLENHSNHFHVIIPAAGRGSRLGFELPKILYPIAGKTILERLLEAIQPWAARVTLVLNPAGVGPVQRELNSIESYPPLQIAIQSSPVGMVDAILKAEPYVTIGEDIMILWGDQVLISQMTISNMVKKYFEFSPAAPRLVFPTLELESPYVHYVRDSNLRIINCLMRRDGDPMPQRGETDCGVFLLKSGLLKSFLPKFNEIEMKAHGNQREVSFPRFIPFLSLNAIPVATSVVEDPIESIGLNDENDLHTIEERINRWPLDLR